MAASPIVKVRGVGRQEAANLQNPVAEQWVGLEGRWRWPCGDHGGGGALARGENPRLLSLAKGLPGEL